MTETTANKLAIGSCVIAVTVVVIGFVLPFEPMVHDPKHFVRGIGEGRLMGHIIFAVVGMIVGGIALRASRRFRRMDISIKAAIGTIACVVITVIRVVTLVNT